MILGQLLARFDKVGRMDFLLHDLMATPATSPESLPDRLLLPVLAELRKLPDGLFSIRPLIPDGTGDTWLPISEAAKILHVKPQSVYPLLGDFLVFIRPLKARRLVSLQSVLKFQAATRNPDFWDDPKLQVTLQTWVASQMPA